MSREVFLLGFDSSNINDPKSYSFRPITEMLQRGVGQNPAIQPVVMSPVELGFLGRMEQIASVVSRDNTVRYLRADILELWPTPTINEIQMAAAISSTIASARRSEFVLRSDDEQTIMLVQPQIIDDFLRHNPGGSYQETTQQSPGHFTETNYTVIG